MEDRDLSGSTERISEVVEARSTSKVLTSSLSLSMPSSLYWAWSVLSVFGPMFVSVFYLSPDAYCLYFLSCVVCMGGAAIFSGKHERIAFSFLSSRKSERAVVVFGTLGTATLLAASHTQLILVAPVAGAVCGLSNACYILAWARMYSREGSRSSCMVHCLSLSIGILLAGIISVLPGFLTAAIVLIAPELTTATLFSLSKVLQPPNDPETQDPTNLGAIGNDQMFTTPQTPEHGKGSIGELYTEKARRVLELPIALVAAIALASFAAGYFVGSSIIEEYLMSLAQASLTLIIIGVFLLGIWLLLYNIPRKAAILLMGLSLIGVFGFFLWAETEAILKSAGYALMLIGLLGCFMVIWSMLTELSYTIGKDAVIAFGSGVFVASLGLLCGVISCIVVVSIPLPFEITSFFQISVGFLLVIAVFVLFVGNSKLWSLVQCRAFSVQTVFGDAFDFDSERKDPDCHLREISSNYGLTDRETEILVLLSSGRSRPRIAKTLVLSENTVNSHVQHIYRKLNVHGHQELLDLIDSTK